MKSFTKRATVYFDPDLHQALRIKAAEQDQSLSALVNDAVQRALAEDAIDLGAFEDRANEKSVSFESVLKKLRLRGKL